MSRNVLFYSEYCFFSKDVLALITKKNMTALFLLVCVDAYRSQLPAFVQSVPTIFTHDHRVLEGQSTLDFIDMLRPSHGTGSSDCGAASLTHDPLGDDYCPMECAAWSDGYSFLEPGDNTGANGMGAFSAVMDNANIECVPENSNRKAQGKDPAMQQSEKGTPLSNYIASRDNDTKMLRSQQLGAGALGQQLHR